MSLNLPLLVVLSYCALAIGVCLGALGLVRSGAILIALGTAGVAAPRGSQRKVRRYLPLALALALFCLAFAIPRGR